MPAPPKPSSDKGECLARCSDAARLLRRAGPNRNEYEYECRTREAALQCPPSEQHVFFSSGERCKPAPACAAGRKCVLFGDKPAWWVMEGRPPPSGVEDPEADAAGAGIACAPGCWFRERLHPASGGRPEFCEPVKGRCGGSRKLAPAPVAGLQMCIDTSASDCSY